jgi:hypothetical protein
MPKHQAPPDCWCALPSDAPVLKSSSAAAGRLRCASTAPRRHPDKDCHRLHATWQPVCCGPHTWPNLHGAHNGAPSPIRPAPPARSRQRRLLPTKMKTQPLALRPAGLPSAPSPTNRPLQIWLTSQQSIAVLRSLAARAAPAAGCCRAGGPPSPPPLRHLLQRPPLALSPPPCAAPRARRSGRGVVPPPPQRCAGRCCRPRASPGAAAAAAAAAAAGARSPLGCCSRWRAT